MSFRTGTTRAVKFLADFGWHTFRQNFHDHSEAEPCIAAADLLQLQNTVAPGSSLAHSLQTVLRVCTYTAKLRVLNAHKRSSSARTHQSLRYPSCATEILLGHIRIHTEVPSHAFETLELTAVTRSGLHHRQLLLVAAILFRPGTFSSRSVLVSSVLDTRI